MWFADIKKTKCKKCYACVGACPVNAIKVREGKVSIIKERCIVCGRCSKVCNQKNKIILPDINLVKQYIKNGEKVIWYIEPSFAGIYGKYSSKIAKVLENFGLDYIQESIVGIDPVIEVYNNYANKEDDKCYMTSFCPSINNLTQKHHPELIDNLIPVVPSYICHSRLLKEKYGKKCKIVFIGPCIARKVDAYGEDSIDAVLTFGELEKWIRDEGIILDEEDINYEFGSILENRRLYSALGGITDKIVNKKKKINKVDGIEECIEVIEAIKNGKLKNTLFEMTACRYGCLGCLGMPGDSTSYYERKEHLENYLKDNKYKLKEDEDDLYKDLYTNLNKISINKDFLSLYKPFKYPNEEEIREILETMGKNKKEAELNCGNCGYSTCREKAIAVYNNVAEISMCIPFMKKKSEDLTNVLFETTPNLILLVNKDLNIITMNPAAKKFFGINEINKKGIPVIMFLDEEIFNEVKNTKRDLIKEKVNISYNNATVIQSIIWIEDSQIMLWIADDITKDENQEKKYQKMKFDAVSMAQKVINNQMVVAQEIASLLGETTAETKVTLTKLKNIIQEEGNIR